MSKLKIALAALVLVLVPGVATARVNCEIPANAAQYAEALGQQINAQRRANGLRPLRMDSGLQTAAIRHACDMAGMGRITHVGSNGSNVQQRARAQGMQACTIAENTAWGRPYEQPANLVAGWMGSPGHRYNILLDRGVTYFGAGIAYRGNVPYWSWVVPRPC